MSQSQCPGTPSQAPYPYALVGRYPANKLIGHELISKRQALRSPSFTTARFRAVVICGFSPGFPGLFPT